MMLVLFGPPGVGKTYIGNLMSRSRGCSFFDADAVFTDEEFRLIRDMKFDLKSRAKYFDRMMKIIDELLSNGIENLIVAQAFTKDVSRVAFEKRYGKSPGVRFAMVKASKFIASQRVHDRSLSTSHPITSGVFEQIWSQFEVPTIEHSLVYNTEVSDEELVSMVEKIMDI